MPGPRVPPEIPTLPWNTSRTEPRGATHTERLVRETWRHYYVAQLAEAQFGPTSLEASIARSRALMSYRELRGSMRDLDPYYRPQPRSSDEKTPAVRHLRLVRDEPPENPAQSDA